MTATCRQIGTAVTRIQEAYLEAPGLALTLAEAGRRFRLDAVTCGALLALLQESGVLTSERGAFRLRQPRRPSSRAPRAPGGSRSRRVRLQPAA
jgi:hypothetical protein